MHSVLEQRNSYSMAISFLARARNQASELLGIVHFVLVHDDNVPLDHSLLPLLLFYLIFEDASNQLSQHLQY